MTLDNMYNLSSEEILNLIKQGKSLHRFPNKKSDSLYYNIHFIKDNYDGINQFFNTNEDEFLHRLTSLKGIGMHKAIQAVILYGCIDNNFNVSNNLLLQADKECNGIIVNLERDKNLILKV